MQIVREFSFEVNYKKVKWKYKINEPLVSKMCAVRMKRLLKDPSNFADIYVNYMSLGMDLGIVDVTHVKYIFNNFIKSSYREQHWGNLKIYSAKTKIYSAETFDGEALDEESYYQGVIYAHQAAKLLFPAWFTSIHGIPPADWIEALKYEQRIWIHTDPMHQVGLVRIVINENFDPKAKFGLGLKKDYIGFRVGWKTRDQIALCFISLDYVVYLSQNRLKM